MYANYTQHILCARAHTEIQTRNAINVETRRVARTRLPREYRSSRGGERVAAGSHTGPPAGPRGRGRGWVRRPAACAALPPVGGLSCVCATPLGLKARSDDDGARGGYRLPRRLGGAEAEPYRRIFYMHACEHARVSCQPKTTEEALGLRTPPCSPMRSGGAQPAAYPPAACCCCCPPPPPPPPDSPLP